MAGRATNRLRCDPYIYSGSQHICTILIQCFSVPLGFKAPIVQRLLTGFSIRADEIENAGSLIYIVI
jgi:hypothetical protein